MAIAEAKTETPAAGAAPAAEKPKEEAKEEPKEEGKKLEHGEAEKTVPHFMSPRKSTRESKDEKKEEKKRERDSAPRKAPTPRFRTSVAKKEEEKKEDGEKKEDPEEGKKDEQTVPHFMSPRQKVSVGGDQKPEEEKKPKERKPPKEKPAKLKPKPKPKEEEEEPVAVVADAAQDEDAKRQTTTFEEFGSPSLMKLTKICMIRQEIALQQIEEAKKRAAERKMWAATGKVNHEKFYQTPVNVYQPLAFFESQGKAAKKEDEAGDDGERPASATGTNRSMGKWLPSSTTVRLAGRTDLCLSNPLRPMTFSTMPAHSAPAPSGPGAPAPPASAPAAVRPASAAGPVSWGPEPQSASRSRPPTSTASRVHTEVFPWTNPKNQ